MDYKTSKAYLFHFSKMNCFIFILITILALFLIKEIIKIDTENAKVPQNNQTLNTTEKPIFYLKSCEKIKRKIIRPISETSLLYMVICENGTGNNFLSIFSHTNQSFSANFSNYDIMKLKKFLSKCATNGVNCDRVYGPYPHPSNGCSYYANFLTFKLCYGIQLEIKNSKIQNELITPEELLQLQEKVNFYL